MNLIKMEAKQIINEIELAGASFPLTTMRQAFGQNESLTPVLLDAVQKRAAAKNSSDIRLQRVATFGLFFLAQHRDRRLLQPMVQLLESVDPWEQDEWLFSNRVGFFAHRLLAGVCPLDAQTPMDLALNPKLKSFTRTIAMSTIGMMAAYGDITRAEAVQRHRQLYKPVQILRDPEMDGCWARAAVKLDSKAFERELQWFLASGRLDSLNRTLISSALRVDPETSFASIVALEPLVNMFINIFSQDMREGEIGFLPNGEIPFLEHFREAMAPPRTN